MANTNAMNSECDVREHRASQLRLDTLVPAVLQLLEVQLHLALHKVSRHP